MKKNATTLFWPKKIDRRCRIQKCWDLSGRSEKRTGRGGKKWNEKSSILKWKQQNKRWRQQHHRRLLISNFKISQIHPPTQTKKINSNRSESILILKNRLTQKGQHDIAEWHHSDEDRPRERLYQRSQTLPTNNLRSNLKSLVSIVVIEWSEAGYFVNQ